LWIWATLYRKDRGWGFSTSQVNSEHIGKLEQELQEMKQRIVALEQGIK